MNFLQKSLFIFFLTLIGFLIVFKMTIYTVRETLELVVVIEKEEFDKFEKFKNGNVKRIPINLYFEKKNY
tara:strand:- start:172 stop:381 length:210 start_codon:yes stop_codon:yes gene_type:complete